MPSFASIKFGLEMAFCVLAVICLFLAGYWKTNEVHLGRKLHKK